jgi:hypothetical protein
LALVVALGGSLSLFALNTGSASASKHKPTHKHATGKTPCLVGNWTVTNFTLNNSGFSASGGAGTVVDISANRKVVGKFTPGAVLRGPNGETIKFTGTDYGSYGFNAKTKSKSGSFPVTYNSASNLMISINGAASTSAGQGATSGSYHCQGKDLTLSFPPGGNEITYVLVPTK